MVRGRADGNVRALSHVQEGDMKRLVLAGLLVALLTVQVVAAGATFRRGTLIITQGTRQLTLQVEVADTPQARAQGLMHRNELAERAGMLFIFEETGNGAFWMKNTLIPLSVAFIDERWRIVDIKDMAVAPDPERGPFAFYESAKPYRYALEVNQGFFRRNGITVGAQVTYRPIP